MGDTKNLTFQVVDVGDCNLDATQTLGHFLCGFVRFCWAQYNIVVVWRQGVVTWSIDGTSFVTCDLVEPAAFVEQLADCGYSSSKQDTRSAAFLQSHLHGFRDTQTDAVWGLEYEFAQEFC